MKTLLEEFTAEVRAATLEGSRVIPKRDGSVVRIPYREMDAEEKARFLDLCVDFTDYVNRGMDPEEGGRILTEILAEEG